MVLAPGASPTPSPALEEVEHNFFPGQNHNLCKLCPDQIYQSRVLIREMGSELAPLMGTWLSHKCWN